MPARHRRRASKAERRWERRAKALQSRGGGLPRHGVWAGLALVGLGWAVQVLVTLPGGVGREGGNAGASLGVAQSLMLTGFGGAILAALHNGFGVLNRFFEAVLQRSAVAASPPPPPSPPPTPTTVGRTDASTITGRGKINDRAFVAFADGSVEVETLLGSRRFKSLDEGRAFVGA